MSEIQQGKSCGFHNAEGVRSQTAVLPELGLPTCGQGGSHLWSGWYCVLHNHRAGGGSAVCPDEPQGLTYMGNAAAGRAPQNLEGHPRLALETLLPSGPSLTFLSWTHYRDHPACPGELSSPSLKPSLPGQVALVNPSLSGPQSPGNRVS